jgi:hypothetical protein
MRINIRPITGSATLLTSLSRSRAEHKLSREQHSLGQPCRDKTSSLGANLVADDQ